MDYGEILGKSWKVIWKHKILWVFGFLASCGSGSGGGSSSGGTSSTPSGSGFDGGSLGLPEGVEQFFNQAIEFFESIPPESYIIVAVIAVLAILVLSIVVWIIASFGKGGLVHGIIEADDGADRLSFGELFNAGLENLLNVVLIHLVESLAGLLLVLLIILPVVVVAVLSFGVGLICLIPLICLMIPIFWAVSIWVRMAVVSAINQKSGVIESYKNSYKLIRENLGPVVIMSLVLFIGGGIANAIISLPMILISIPIIMGIIGGAMSGSGAVLGTGLTVGIVGLCIYLPVLIVLSSALQSYIWAGLTLTYRRLRDKPLEIDLPLGDGLGDDVLIEDGA